jgi:hypothetical protein
MAKLTGTNPDQVPTNADLGTMAYQDKDNVKIDGGDVALENITLDSSPSAGSYAIFKYDGVQRWQLGNNSSNDIKINRFDSSGSFIDQPFTVSGSTGIVTIPDQLSRSSGVTRLRGSSNVDGVVIESTGEVQVPSGLLELDGNDIGGTQVTIADDAVASITPPRNGGFMAIFSGGTSDYPTGEAWSANSIYYDVGASLAIQSRDTYATNVEVTTSDVTGTTGTDAKITIAAQTGVIKIENRSGGSIQFQITFL